MQCILKKLGIKLFSYISMSIYYVILFMCISQAHITHYVFLFSFTFCRTPLNIASLNLQLVHEKIRCICDTEERQEVETMCDGVVAVVDSATIMLNDVIMLNKIYANEIGRVMFLFCLSLSHTHTGLDKTLMNMSKFVSNTLRFFSSKMRDKHIHLEFDLPEAENAGPFVVVDPVKMALVLKYETDLMPTLLYFFISLSFIYFYVCELSYAKTLTYAHTFSLSLKESHDWGLKYYTY